MTSLQITGFGKLTLSNGSKHISNFPTRQVEELLAYLLLNQSVLHERDKLIDILWPSCLPVNGRGSLSTVLWRLRNIFRDLGFQACIFVQGTRDSVSFAPQCDIQFDVHKFDRLLVRARCSDALSEKFSLLQEAINLYQGELYATIDADWCLVERERMARQHLRALGDLMYCFMQRESYRKAVELGDRILIEDPLREEIYRAKMVCFARLGLRVEVAKEFRQCIDQLQTELAILPLPQTIRTYQSLMETCLQVVPTPVDHSQEQRLQKALIEFQKAGDRLNKLLDETDAKK